MEIEDDVERGAGKNKRKWTEEEDEKLIEALLELVNAGTHRADNGFKPGYLVVLEKALLTKLPGSGIKGKPHIDSRIKTLKKDFFAVYDMRYNVNTSGFGWDDEKQLVTAKKATWDTYLKVHHAARKWKTTPFPLFDDYCTIFGKDRATGQDAQSAADVIEELNEEHANDQGATNGLEELNVGNSRATCSDESTSKRPIKKRKRTVDPIVEVVEHASKLIVSELHEATEKFSRAIGVDMDLMDQKKKINEELSNIPGLSKGQRFRAAKELAERENLMVLFFTIPDHERYEWVDLLLRGEFANN